jgi:hypothetical protein
VAKEVKLNQLGLLMLDDLDNKKVIDVVGIGLKYFPTIRRWLRQEEFDEFSLDSEERYEYGYNVLRGIEVKVSRGDFKNGFICTSCNYNYVLTPMKMISQSTLPKGVGLIEYNRYKFSCEPNHNQIKASKPFTICGLRVIKRASYRNLPQFHIDHAIAEIANKSSETRIEGAFSSLSSKITDPKLVYQR